MKNTYPPPPPDATQVDGELVNALESECPVVSQTFRTLQFTGRVDSGDGGACSSLHSGGYMINMQRVVTPRPPSLQLVLIFALPDGRAFNWL